MMCSSGVGTGKVQIGATFTLAGVASLSQSLRGQSSWPELRKGDIQEETIYLTLEEKC